MLKSGWLALISVTAFRDLISFHLFTGTRVIFFRKPVLQEKKVLSTPLSKGFLSRLVGITAHC